MDIEPFLIASSVEMIVAQRLVRRLCPACAQPAHYDELQIKSFLATMRIDPAEAAHAHLAKRAVGCERCRKLGFRGRVGIFEILRVSDEIHEHIVNRDSARLIRETAIAQGMRSLMQSGWAHIKAGTTTFEEALRYAELDSD
jgi:type II secretory ATPase GspE/PulE/Tfp pilus assembly ATPase PilB-like protein